MDIIVKTKDGNRYIATLLVATIEEGEAALSFVSSGVMNTFPAADIEGIELSEPEVPAAAPAPGTAVAE